MADAAPQVNNMTRDINFLGNMDSVAVRQTRRGCLQELMGCEAKSEFNITHPDNKEDRYLYALEESNFWIRLCCAPLRPFQINVSWPDATNPEDPKFAIYDRPFRLANGPCKCCCYQEVTASANGAIIGTTVETCYYCIPTFAVKDAQGAHKYNIHMQTCCGGMCVDLCAAGCCNCKIPFYLYDPAQDEPGKHVGEITKVWGGLGKELFSDADTFKIIYPPNIDGAMKANLLGSTFLLNQLFFEAQQQGGAAIA